MSIHKLEIAQSIITKHSMIRKIKEIKEQSPKFRYTKEDPK